MKKMAVILNLWVKFRSNYHKTPRNEFIDLKSHENDKLQIPMREINGNLRGARRDSNLCILWKITHRITW